MGASDAQTLTGLPRGRGLRRPVADHRLQPLHRPRLRPAPRHGPAEGGGPVGPLAAVPLQPRAGRAGQEPARRSTRRPPSMPLEKYVYNETRYTHAGPEPTRTRPAAARGRPQEDVHERWRTLRAAGPRLSGAPPDGGDPMIDLSTTYLGLTLREPAGAARRRRCARSLDNLAPDGGRRGRRRSCCTRCSRSRSTLREPRPGSRYLDHGAESYAEALTYFPDLADYNLGPDALPRAHPPGQGRRAASRSSAASTAISARRLGRATPADRAGRRRRAGAERLLHPDRPGHDRREVEERRTSTWCATSSASVRIPVAVKLSPFFSAAGQPGAPARPRRARTRWCCSTASTSRTSTWRAWRSCRTCTLSSAGRAAAAAALGRHPLRPRPGRPRRHRRRPHRRRTS